MKKIDAGTKAHTYYIVIQTLLAIANTMASSFTLVFLLRTGFSYSYCALFVMVMAASATFCVAFFHKFMTSRLKASMILGLVSISLYYLAFVTLQGYSMFFLASALQGIYISFFWVPYNVLIMRAASRKLRGAIVGVYFLVFPAVSVLGPLMGGAVISTLGYNTLFLSAVAILVANMAVIGMTDVDYFADGNDKEPSKPARRLTFGDMGTGLRRALFFEGLQDGVFWIYPVIVGFEFAGSELSLGTVLSLFAFMGALMTVVLGFASDRIRNRAVFLAAGGILAAVFCILTALAYDFFQFLVLMSIVSLFLAVVPSFLFTVTTDEMEGKFEKGSALREVLLNIGRATAALMCMILVVVLGNLRYATIIAGIALVAIVVVRRRRQEEGAHEGVQGGGRKLAQYE